MNILLLIVSKVLGLIPFNHLEKKASFYDFIAMLLAPSIYVWSYIMATFNIYSVNQLEGCNSICSLGNSLFINLGMAVYLITFLVSLSRLKRFYPEFYTSLNEIDEGLLLCELHGQEQKEFKSISKKKTDWFVSELMTITILTCIFIYAIYFDISSMKEHFGQYFFLATMTVTFPFISSSIVQGQFVYLIYDISVRFSKLNKLMDVINEDCEKQGLSLKIFDVEVEANAFKMKKSKDILADDSDTDDKGKLKDQNNRNSEITMANLFNLHDKILNLSVLTNSEFAPQIVPYMAVCFIISIFGIFLETKVIFIVGGKNVYLDYVAQIYVVWSITTMMVAYLVLRLCCNANIHSKRTAMIIHEIMQKKPPFMLGNELYYNKMKSFTLQFLHWEGFFQFNGIGLFALDYTFIFSTVSAATSYLIVLLQFDMTSILKNEGLAD